MADATQRVGSDLLSPRMLGVHLLAVALIAAMAALGWWQSTRYDAQRAAASAQAAALAARADPVPLDAVLEPDGAFPGDQAGAKVAVTGRYAQPQFFVRGKQHRARTGYWVLTPLRTGSSAILVVRGWAGHPGEPAAQEVPAGRVTVVGWLQPPEPAAPTAPTARPPDGRVISTVSTASLVAEVPYDLYSGYVVLSEQRPPSGLPGVPRPVEQVSTSAGWRNLAYAGQWWLFAAFIAFMWWRIARDARVA